MPWTVKDVEKHNKGLTDAQKKRWVEVANLTLENCRKKGGKDCDAFAIRQANGVVANTEMGIYANPTADYEIQTKTLQGRNQLVVPVVMMVEGVHNGSFGPLLHLAEDLGRFPQSWNGIPVVVGHPQSEGQFISANSPDIMEQGVVGRVYNSHMDGTRLLAEAWLDEERLKDVSTEVMDHIQSGKPLEVSLGMFNEEEYTTGIYHNEPYSAIARNHRPDHLALLPGGTGACSWEDGCGVRVNEDLTVLFEPPESGDAPAGLKSILSKVYSDCRGRWVKDHPGDKENSSNKESCSRIAWSAVKKAGYSKQGDRWVKVNEAKITNKKVEYVTMQNNSGPRRTKFDNNSNFNFSKKEVETMANEGKPCCEDLVNELIANERTKFKPEHKEWLMTMQEDQLQLLIPEKEKAPAPPAPQVNAEMVKKWMKDSMSKTEDAIQLFPAEMQDQLKSGLRLHQEKRSNMVKGIMANAKDVWTEDQLKAMDTDSLEKVYKAVVKEVVDYSMNAAGGSLTVNEEKLLPAGVVETKEVKK